MDILPPRASVEFCSRQARAAAAAPAVGSDEEGGGDVGGDANEIRLPPGVTRGDVSRSLPGLFGDDKDDRTGGFVFPGS